MDYDENKVDEVVLALMNLTLHDEIRAWKGFDFRVLDRLYEKGFIRDPKNRTRSVVLTGKGTGQVRRAVRKALWTPTEPNPLRREVKRSSWTCVSGL